MKYNVTADITATVELTVRVDGDGNLKDELAAAIKEALDDRLVLLDIRGARGGRDGIITDSEVTAVNNWNSE